MKDTGPLNQVALLPFVHGNTWDGIQQIGPVLFNQVPPPSALTRVDMHFRKAWNDVTPAYALSSAVIVGAGTMSIVNAATWFVNVPAQALPLPAGTWKWDIQFTAADGTKLTPVGGTLTCLKDVTRL